MEALKMGFHAPSADEVYSYVFRINDNERSLSDRFSWSILLINDSSMICREFLSKYCIDLCNRTADRIRFVFFSNLPDKKIHEIASDYSDGNIDNTRGFLSVLLNRIYPQQIKYDYEEKPWSDLRPLGLIPLHNYEIINKRVNEECDKNTAMPGSEIAMHFAQRLGIGRHVPCLLMFSDIGQLKVHLLPFKDLSVDEIYQRVRYWVDSFYEINHSILERWRMIEQQITEFCNQGRKSLDNIKSWRKECNLKWHNLRKLSEVIHILTFEPPMSWGSITPLQNDWDLTREQRSTIQIICEKVKKCTEQILASQQLQKYIIQLSQPKSISDINNFFHELNKNSSIKSAMPPNFLSNIIIELSKWTSPYNDLIKWWNGIEGRPLSTNRFFRYRNNWVEFSKCLEQSDDRVVLIKKREFQIACEAVNNIPLFTDPEQIASHIINTLAKYYGVDLVATEWLQATHKYYQYLSQYFLYSNTTAPGWLVENSKSLLIGECIPPADKCKKSEMLDFIIKNEKLNTIVQSIEESRLLEGKKYCNIVSEFLSKFSEQLSLAENDLYADGNALMEYIVFLRADLEEQVLNILNPNNYRLPTIEPKVDAKRLLQYLEEYEFTTQKIVLPYEEDPSVITYPLYSPLIEAANISNSYLTNSPLCQKLKGSIHDAMGSFQETKNEWPNVKNEAKQWNSVVVLCEVLKKVLGVDRLSKILEGYSGANQFECVMQIIRNSKTYELLINLSDEELRQLWECVSNETTLLKNLKSPESKRELSMRIIASIGVLSTPETYNTYGKINKEKIESLKKKVEKHSFDVFIAYNSVDKEEIQKICKQLYNEGIYPWVDSEQVPPGQWFQDVIQSAIRNAKCAAIFIGKYGIGRWQVLEIRSFIHQCVENGIPVIPVLLPGVIQFPPDLIFLRELNYVRFNESVTEPRRLNLLIWGITGENPVGI
jgi:hypothetical protein